MPQDGSNNYQYPPGTPGIPNQTIESEAYNTFLDDLVVNDLNIARPVHRGGTGATIPYDARQNLDTEVAMAHVTNYDTHIFEAGSFYSSASATGSPIPGSGFSGTAHLYTDTNNVTLEAYTYPAEGYGEKWIRQKISGTWYDWFSADGRYVNVTGDTMTGNLNIAPSPAGHAQIILNKLAPGYATVVAGQTAGKYRWQLVLGNETAETGANAGSDFMLFRFADDGIAYTRSIYVERKTGALVLERDPVNPLEAATKKYVDEQIAFIEANYVKKAGDTMTGTLTFQLTGSIRAWDVHQGGVNKAYCVSDGRIFGTTSINLAGPDPAVNYHTSGWAAGSASVWFETSNSRLKLQMSAANGSGDAYLNSGATGHFSVKGLNVAHDPAFGLAYDSGGGGVYYLSFLSGTWLKYDTTNGLTWVRGGNNDMVVAPGGQLTMWATNAYKYAAGDWAAYSDERIKNVVGDYARGLDAIKQIQPVRYTYKGNDTYGATPPAGQAAPYVSSPGMRAARDVQEFIGLIAQPVEPVMPEMVGKTSGFIDGQPVDDMRTLDTTALIYALVNSVKELSARVEQLEAAG